jgi:uncharacterized protein YcbK (DUF882 family)
MKKLSRTAAFASWTALALALILVLVCPGPLAVKSQGDRSGIAPAYAATVDSLLPATPAPQSPPRLLASGELLGLSGRLRATMGTTDVLDENPELRTVLASSDASAGWPKIPTADGDSFTVVTLVPMKDADQAGYGRYHVGSWPEDAMAKSAARYTPPNGFIGVTRANQDTRLSENFRVRDFLTHDQADVWPKVLVIQPRLLDKLELLRAELGREGYPNRLHVMSGFRTPQYNALGVGKGGRATHSRHMYGDASDVFVDADGNGWMDDLNGDGKVDIKDAYVIKAAAERVEAQYPALVGGIGTYPSNGVHGPFVHVDARGYKARWGE